MYWRMLDFFFYILMSIITTSGVTWSNLVVTYMCMSYMYVWQANVDKNQHFLIFEIHFQISENIFKY